MSEYRRFLFHARSEPSHGKTAFDLERSSKSGLTMEKKFVLLIIV